MKRRARLSATLFGALLASATIAHAQAPAAQPKSIVELFTSQGCSSCPPADALMVEISKDPSILPLTLPVTYWDYLGWKDTLGQDVFTKRQKFYAKARGDGQVYTPQAVINGASHVVGSDKAEIERTLRHQPPGTLPARISLSEDRDNVQIKLAPITNLDGRAGVWILPIAKLVTVPIARGENEGRTISYVNVVRGMVRVGDWDGKEATLTAPLAATRAVDANSYVVVVQAEQPGKYGMMPAAILGAARSPR